MNVLVTGATGRLGKRVCPALIQAGHDVRATDLNQVRDFPVPVVVENLLHREACYRLTDGMDAVVHLGNYPNDLLTDHQRLFLENVTMNMNIVQASIEQELKKLVFSSSVQIFSGSHRHQPPSNEDDKPPCLLPYLPVDSDVPPQPANAYAVSKQVGEDLLAYAARTSDMQCIAIRFPWLANARAREWMEKRQARDPLNARRRNEAFTHLSFEDAAELVDKVLGTDLPGYRHYFPAAHSNTTRMDIHELLAAAYPDTPLRIPADQMTSLVDISRITEETGWEPSE